MTTNLRSMHFLQTQALQQLTHAPQTFTKKTLNFLKMYPQPETLQKKDPHIHDDQPTTPAF